MTIKDELRSGLTCDEDVGARVLELADNGARFLRLGTCRNPPVGQQPFSVSWAQRERRTRNGPSQNSRS